MCSRREVNRKRGCYQALRGQKRCAHACSDIVGSGGASGRALHGGDGYCPARLRVHETILVMAERLVAVALGTPFSVAKLLKNSFGDLEPPRRGDARVGNHRVAGSRLTKLDAPRAIGNAEVPWRGLDRGELLG